MNHIIHRIILALGVGFSSVAVVAVQSDAQDLDYSLFAEVLVDDPDAAGDASFHLLRVPAQSTIPLQLDGGAGLTWSDGDPLVHANIKLRRRHRLEVGGRIDVDPGGDDFSGGVIGLRHQIHKYLAWGINATTQDRPAGTGSDTGGSFVFLVRKRSWMGTPLGIKSQLGLGIGNAISADGVGLRGSAETDWAAAKRLTVLVGVKGRSVTEDLSGQVGVDGWLAAHGALSERISLRLSLGLGLMGDGRQQDPSAGAFVVFAPNP